MRRPADLPETGGEQGFTTLEALVAITLLAIALVPLLSFQSQVVNGSVRLEARADRFIAQASAYEYLSTIDYGSLPEGEMEIGGGWILSWVAKPDSPLTPVRYGAGLSSRYAYQPVIVEAELAKSGIETFAFRRQELVIAEQLPAAPL